MKEKILSLLAAKFPGVRKDGLAQLSRTMALTVTTEEEAQSAVEKLEDAQVTEFITDWRKDVDSEVSKGNKTFESNLKKKYEFVEKKDDSTDPPAPGKEGGPADLATMIKNAVAEAVKPYSEKLSAFEGAEISKNRRTTLEEKLAGSPAAFKEKVLKDFGRMSFETEETFNEYLTETETDLNKFKQELANEGLSKFGRPFAAAESSPDSVSNATQAYLDAKAGKEGSSLGGKEV